MYLIFSDLDSTLYENGPSSLSAINFHKIRQVNAQGIHFVINTGNGYFSLMKNLAKKLTSTYVITSTGALIYDRKLEKVLHQLTVEPKIISNLYQHFKDQKNIFFCGWNLNDFYLSSNAYDFLIEEIRLKMINNDPIKEFDGQIKDCLNLLIMAKEEQLKKVIAYVKKNNFNWLLIDKYTVCILHQDASKGNAVKWLANHLKISLDKVMTIGDSTNDHSMLALPVYSYAVANADQKTKEIAKYHSPTAWQNGLSYAIDDFLFRLKNHEKK